MKVFTKILMMSKEAGEKSWTGEELLGVALILREVQDEIDYKVVVELLTVWSLIIDQYSLLRLTIGLVLTIDLIVKLLFEENLLKKHFVGYGIYMKETKRLIPFVI